MAKTKNKAHKGFALCNPKSLPEIEFIEGYTFAQKLSWGEPIDSYKNELLACPSCEFRTVSLIAMSHKVSSVEIINKWHYGDKEMVWFIIR